MNDTAEIQFAFDRPVTAEQLLPLYAQTHWADKRSAEETTHVIAHADVTISGWQGERLVAFARVLTDDRYRAFIDDVIVDNTLRSQGTGSELMRRLVERLEHVEEVFLHCEPELNNFYGRRGFEPYGKCLLIPKSPH
jgi:predicted GNAT family N-acyltransferase